jgi:capsular polysaccharide biosynthesis protein
MFDRTQHLPGWARRFWPLAAAVPLGTLVGGGYAVLAPPEYTANSYVVVVSDQTSEPGQTVNFAQAYGRLAGQPQVLALAAGDAGRTPAELASLVSATTSPDAPVIEIDGTGGSPQDAARTADAVARALIGFGNGSSRDTGVRLVHLANAAAPDRPTSPNRGLDLAVGAAAGVLLGSMALMVQRRTGGEERRPEATEPVLLPGPARERPAGGPRPAGELEPAKDARPVKDAGPAGEAQPARELEAAEGPESEPQPEHEAVEERQAAEEPESAAAEEPKPRSAAAKKPSGTAKSGSRPARKPAARADKAAPRTEEPVGRAS